MIDAIWNAMLDADMNKRYWRALRRRYIFRERGGKIIFAFISSGSFFSLFFAAEVSSLWHFFSASMAIFAFIFALLDWPKEIASMSLIATKWVRITREYEDLWYAYCDANLSESIIKIVRKKFEKIRLLEETYLLEEDCLPEDDKLINKCYQEVVESRGLLREE